MTKGSIDISQEHSAQTESKMERFQEDLEKRNSKMDKTKWVRSILAIWLVVLILGAILAVAITVSHKLERKACRIAKFPVMTEEELDELSSQKLVSARWLPDGRVLISKEDETTVGRIGQEFQTLNTSEVEAFPIESPYLVGSGVFAVAVESKHVFRHSTSSIYSLYAFRPTGDSSEQYLSFINNITLAGENSTHISYVQPNPVDDSFVFVSERSLYYQPGVDSPPSPVLLSTAETDFVAIADWLYEEEITYSPVVSQWSESGARLAFARFDDSAVPTFAYPVYGHNDSASRILSFPYPRVGDPLPSASLYVWTRSTNESVELEPPAEVVGWGEWYLHAVKWLPSAASASDREALVVVWANRLQNLINIALCDEAGQWLCRQLTRFDYTSGPLLSWLEPTTMHSLQVDTEHLYLILPGFVPRENSSSSLATEPEPHSHPRRASEERNFYHQIAAVSTRDGALRLLSTGPGDVVKLLGLERGSGRLSYAAKSPDGTERRLYSIDVRDTSLQPQLLSGNCTWVDRATVWARNSSVGFVACGGPGPARFSLQSGAEREVLEDNAELSDSLAANRTNLPTVQFKSLPLGNGFAGNARVVLPVGLAESGKGSRPLLYAVYGGPGADLATQAWSTRVGTTLSGWEWANRGFVHASVDGRGTGRDWRFRSAIHGRMGIVEIADQLEGLRQILSLYPQINASQVAVSGWSYGGFASLHMALAAEVGLIRCVAAGAPVTDFALYDAAYTERYMGLREANAEAYAATDVTRANLSQAFANTRLLLLHGTADDNVHFRNTAKLMMALQEQGVHFRSMVLPDEQHGVSNRRDYVRQGIHRFVHHCFSR